MSVDCISGADAGEAKGAVGVDAKRLLDHGVKVLERLQRLVLDLIPRAEGIADLLLQPLHLLGLSEQEVHGRREQIGVRIESADDEVVGLRYEEVIRRQWPVLGK